ncbi:uncharacterized protein LOC127751376 [Frankliniella occidentalis]|uniref:Uncharacterized protein LOC127751376 n=1 Tax=Frankliniella occidentalis TaxID=133901 RepID=A0A9C6X7Q3_FRAOC|nr:uncharacterized protein LOC127751376 [Frankliniella occidentalis]
MASTSPARCVAPCATPCTPRTPPPSPPQTPPPSPAPLVLPCVFPSPGLRTPGRPFNLDPELFQLEERQFEGACAWLEALRLANEAKKQEELERYWAEPIDYGLDIFYMNNNDD